MNKFFAALKKVKLSTLIIGIVLLMFNSYAWFIYATKVSTGFNIKVSSWNVSFIAGQDETTTNVNFNVDRVYPGMTTYSNTLTAHNNGEMSANLSYEIKSLTILGTTYTVGDGVTSIQLERMLQTDYPFHINITISNASIQAVNGESVLTISLDWPYESGDDEEDTLWGERAYEFYEDNPTANSINLQLEVKAEQQSP